MFKKGILAISIVALVVFVAGLAFAIQIDGLQSNSGPALPTGLSVFVNPGGTGDALLYGYYDVRGGALNFLRVVNTSETAGVAAKVRFREGVYSHEVLDFYICLSAADQWSAWLLENGTVGALVSWDDDTPTVPSTTQGDVINFSSGAANVVTDDMTMEGYFEIIGVFSWADTPGKRAINDSNECGQILRLTGFTGNPDMDNDGSADANFPTLYDVDNVLAGSNVLFDLSGGSAYAYNATALGDCMSSFFVNNSLQTDNPPRLDNCDDGIAGVNYALTKGYMYGMYDLEFDGATQFINTFPTKKLSVEFMGTSSNPFDPDAIIDIDGRVCVDSNTDGDCNDALDESQVCVTVEMTPYDDEENTISPETGFSPGKPTKLKKCNEVSIVVVGDTANPIIDSTLVDINLNVGTFQLGWVKEDFVSGGYSSSFAGSTTYGLPVIGLEMSNLVNGDFGWMLPMRYATDFFGGG